MEKQKVTNNRDRKKLMSLFSELEKLLENPDEAVQMQLEMENVTKNYQERLQDNRALMEKDQCPVFVVGEWFHLN